MNDIVAKFIRGKRINSFQKLHFLLFLYQHPHLTGTRNQLAKRLHFGDLPLLEEIVNDLRISGLLDCAEDSCRLRDEPEVRLCLECLTTVFEDPLARQELLDQVGSHASFNR